MRWLLTILALLFALAGYVLLVYTPEQVKYSERYPTTRTPAEVSLEYRDVVLNVTEDKLNLEAWFIPATTAPRAAVLFIHGGSSNRHSDFFDAMGFYKALAERGYSVLTLDLRNHGNSDSDGEGMSFGVRESRDALTALAWLESQLPETPLFMMGISMGGATAIHAVARGASPDGLILLDPLLDTDSVFTLGIWTQLDMNPALFLPAAWSARTFFGFPSGDNEAKAIAETLELPTLLMQDPGDPVTLALHARDVAANNPAITYWEAPAIDTSDPGMAWRGRWGSHVAAFAVHPEQTLATIERFTAEVMAGSR